MHAKEGLPGRQCVKAQGAVLLGGCRREGRTLFEVSISVNDLLDGWQRIGSVFLIPALNH